jgi:hypothetical protein
VGRRSASRFLKIAFFFPRRFLPFIFCAMKLLEKWMLKSQPSATVQLSVGLMLGVSPSTILTNVSFHFA